MRDDKLNDEELRYFAYRPSSEYDELVSQADYCARASLSFYRFRMLGGGRSDSTSSKIQIGNPTGHGIHYVSDHPQMRILHLSVILLLILFESAANAWFFAQQSEFGISGGLFQAAAVSLANVAVSYFLIGFWGLRHSAMPVGKWSWFPPNGRMWIKFFGILAVIVGIFLVLLVNLSAAHYRNILDLRAEGLVPMGEYTASLPRFWISSGQCEAILGSEIGKSIGGAATNAMCRPFSLHSLDAMVLFALGVAISCLAAYEGRRSDSPFPGLSDAARHLEKARRDMQDALADYYDTYDDVIEDIEDTLGDGHSLSPDEKVKVRKMMDDRVASYQRYLKTDPLLLRDEFDVPQEVVTRVTGRQPTELPINSNPLNGG